MDISSIITNTGESNTYLVQGEMGVGKSAILHHLHSTMRTGHVPVMFDCAIASVGDLFLPYFDDGQTAFAPTIRMGIKSKRPVMICLDEIGKATPDVINALLPLLLERRMAEHSLPSKSIVFATTNIADEALGDTIPSHALNRMGRLYMRKPTSAEWCAWAVDHGVAPEIIAWVEATPSLMATFMEMSGASDNPYIYHPDRGETMPFVSPRSLALASGPIKMRNNLSNAALFHAVGGIIGESGAADLQGYLTIGRDLPSVNDVLKNPDNAPLPPKDIGTVIMVISLVQAVTTETVTTISRYVQRMKREAQRIFIVRLKSTSRFRQVLMNAELEKILSQHRPA